MDYGGIAMLPVLLPKGICEVTKGKPQGVGETNASRIKQCRCKSDSFGRKDDLIDCDVIQADGGTRTARLLVPCGLSRRLGRGGQR